MSTKKLTFGTNEKASNCKRVKIQVESLSFIQREKNKQNILNTNLGMLSVTEKDVTKNTECKKQR